MSKNGVVVSAGIYESSEFVYPLQEARILNTPRWANTHGTLQDKLHKKSIATQIERHIDCVTAVLILADGMLLSVLSMHSPSVPLSSPNPLPATLPSCSPMSGVPSIRTSLSILSQISKEAPQFILNNSIPFQEKFKGRVNLRNPGFGNADRSI